MKVHLSNSFSINMLSAETRKAGAFIALVQCKWADVPADAVSAIGHKDTAVLVSKALGREVPASRQSVVLEPGDVLFVAQYEGPRLPEGATELPVGATLTPYRVLIATSVAWGFEGWLTPAEAYYAPRSSGVGFDFHWKSNQGINPPELS